jgi:hypothetical protein
MLRGGTGSEMEPSQKQRRKKMNLENLGAKVLYFGFNC